MVNCLKKNIITHCLLIHYNPRLPVPFLSEESLLDEFCHTAAMRTFPVNPPAFAALKEFIEIDFGLGFQQMIHCFFIDLVNGSVTMDAPRKRLKSHF